MGVGEALARWLAEQIGEDVGVEGLDRVEAGHSAEMLSCTVVTAAGEHDVVVKLRPPAPGLLEPYDLARQFRILRALEPTAVLAPPARWFEPTGAVLGRPFYVMDRVPGTAYERTVPAALDEPGRIPAMCRSLVDQLAEIHVIDLAATGLADLGDAASYVDRELARWGGEVERVRQGPLPVLDRLRAAIDADRPAPSGRAALVHGDAKPGNVGFVGDEATAVFDWEMSDVGDPMADIGYLELMWRYPVGITSRPTAPAIDEVLPRWEARTGITATDRPWWLALAAYKTAVILLVGSMLFETGQQTDERYREMGYGIDFTAGFGLEALGIERG